MDTEKKKRQSKPQIYTGERRSRGAEGTTLTGATRRRREQEQELKLQKLGIVLGILILLLIAAIIYELVL